MAVQATTEKTAVASAPSPPEKKKQKKTKQKDWEQVTYEDIIQTLTRLGSLGFTDSAVTTALIHQYHNDFDKIVAELERRKREQAVGDAKHTAKSATIRLAVSLPSASSFSFDWYVVRACVCVCVCVCVCACEREREERERGEREREREEREREREMSMGAFCVTSFHSCSLPWFVLLFLWNLLHRDSASEQSFAALRRRYVLVLTLLCSLVLSN